MSDGSVTINTELDNSGVKKGLGTLNSTLGKVGSGIKSAFTVGATAITGAAAAFTGLVVASVNARGELEQQIGGIETLFTNELGSASDTVIKNANNAYKTAGMSAIDYMSTATSFSASLLQSLGNDTAKAAEVTDMAITDMADNANKMGTSIESIQWAYQGFAKQNYTMLDNLKLGYGGTKSEMERLLADAQKLTGVKYDISNLSDVYEAIHVIQGELGITGTTAAEASDTLQGSFSSMQAAWNNFLSGSGDLSQVVDTASDVVKNIVRIAGEAVPSIIENIGESLPELLDLGSQIINQLIEGIITYLPTLLESGSQISSSIIQGILTALPQLIPVVLQIITQLVTAFLTYLPQIIQVGIQVISQLIIGIAQALPQLIPVVLQIITQLVTAFLTYLPQIIQVGIQVISQLIIGIAQALPQLIPQIINCILLIVTTLLDNIDFLIDAGIQLIFGLIDGIIEAIPILIDKFPEIIQKILQAIINNLPKILSMGVKLLGKLGEGIVKAIPSLIKNIPKVITAIVDEFKKLPGKLGDLGKSILEGLWNGISNVKNWLVDKIKGLGDVLIDAIKSVLGIHSPSTVFRDEVGKNMALGIGEGFDKNIASVYRKMKTAVDFETQKLSSNLSATSVNNKILTANITLKSSDIYMDSTKVGRAVTPTVSKTLKQGGAFA